MHVLHIHVLQNKKKFYTLCNRSLSFFRAALKAGGSCSSSKSTVMNSSRVNALEGVSPNSISLLTCKNLFKNSK